MALMGGLPRPPKDRQVALEADAQIGRGEQPEPGSSELDGERDPIEHSAQRAHLLVVLELGARWATSSDKHRYSLVRRERLDGQLGPEIQRDPARQKEGGLKSEP